MFFSRFNALLHVKTIFAMSLFGFVILFYYVIKTSLHTDVIDWPAVASHSITSTQLDPSYLSSFMNSIDTSLLIRNSSCNISRNNPTSYTFMRHDGTGAKITAVLSSLAYDRLSVKYHFFYSPMDHFVIDPNHHVDNKPVELFFNLGYGECQAAQLNKTYRRQFGNTNGRIWFHDVPAKELPLNDDPFFYIDHFDRQFLALARYKYYMNKLPPAAPYTLADVHDGLLLYDANNYNVAIHIRRGDADKFRLSPDGYYIAIIKHIIDSPLRYHASPVFHVFSVDNFNITAFTQHLEFRLGSQTAAAVNITFHIGGNNNILASFHSMMHADVLITSLSSFSCVATFYADPDRTIVFGSISNQILPHFKRTYVRSDRLNTSFSAGCVNGEQQSELGSVPVMEKIFADRFTCVDAEDAIVFFNNKPASDADSCYQIVTLCHKFVDAIKNETIL